jgi:uncharacterized membrane protein
MQQDATESSISASIPASASAVPSVRKIKFTDLTDAIAKGVGDFNAKPSHPLFIGLIYPFAMLLAVGVTLNQKLLPLAFPLVSGFALLGPFVALGLYELSRKRERGEAISWRDAFAVSTSPAWPEILKLGGLLLALFLLWMGAAATLYFLTIGGVPISSLGDFVDRVFTTEEGWTMIVLGNGAGFIFAVVVLSISVVSFPMLLDRHVDAGTAVTASVAAVKANPVMMAIWGLIVVGSMVIGAMLLLVGLVVVMPVLGHATWHLYRRVVV